MLTHQIKLLGEKLSKTPLWTKTSINTQHDQHVGTVAVYEKGVNNDLGPLICSYTVSIKDATTDSFQEILNPDYELIIDGLREQHYFRNFNGARDEVLTNLVESLEATEGWGGFDMDDFGRIVYQGDVDFLHVTDDETGKQYEISYDGTITEIN